MPFFLLSAHLWMLILFGPFLLVGGLGAIASVSFNGRPVRPSRRPVFARMVPAGGAFA
jgi:hypothetical protein